MGVVYYANYFVWFEVAAPICCATPGWSYREMEADGFSLPVIEAHCEYRQPARYDDELEMRTTGALLSPVRVQFDYEVVRAADDAAAGRPATPSTRRSIASGRPLPAAGSRAASCSHEGARHRRGRLHRLDARRAAARRRRRRRRHRLLHRLLPARDQGAEPRRRCGAHPRFRFVESRIQDADLAALLADRTHVFHLAAQAASERAGDATSRVYT